MTHRPKNAVLLVTAPSGWHPRRAHDVPPDFTAARFHVKNLMLSEAEVITGTYNLAHLQKDNYVGLWALCVKDIRGWRSRQWQRQNMDRRWRDRRERGNGGAS